MAIAAGVTMGKGLGENARAALITRGLAEMTRMALTQGAQRETLMGFAGLGDLLLTATSLTSRNTSFGLRPRQGPIGRPTACRRREAERGGAHRRGRVPTRPAAGVELPVAEAVRARGRRDRGRRGDRRRCCTGRCRSASDDRPIRLQQGPCLLDPALALDPAGEIDRVVDPLASSCGSLGQLAEAGDAQLAEAAARSPCRCP